MMTLEELHQRLQILEREVQELHNMVSTLNTLVYRLEGRLNMVAAVGSPVTLPNVRYKAN